MAKRTKPEGAYKGSESLFQKSAIKLVRSVAKCDPRLVTHIPNGGQSTIMAGAKLKAEGLQPGESDILYLQPRGEYNCLAIEMKALDKRNSKDAVTPEQLEFIEAVNANGGIGEICYGCDEALNIFNTYMQMDAR